MNIIEKRKMYFLISIAAIVIGVGFMLFNMSNGSGAFNLDVEFTGGISMNVDIGKEFENKDIEKIIKDTTGETAHVQKVLGTTQVSIRMKQVPAEKKEALTKALKEKYALKEGVFQTSEIDGSISSQMQKSALLAVFYACVGILIYVSLRFKDFKLGASAIVALVHDSVLVILAYAIFRIPVGYSFIAVVLTILGYSINATIVIFDRVRENKRLMPRATREEIINKSISQTIRRCIYTSLTVLIVTVCMYVMGVPAIRDFSLPIAVGVIWGTYSSIYLSGSIYYVLLANSKKIA